MPILAALTGITMAFVSNVLVSTSPQEPFSGWLSITVSSPLT